MHPPKEKIMTLDALGLGRPGSIVGIAGRGALAQRLMAMGFLPGTSVKIVQVAPFGDPITVELDGWRVSLRLADAASLSVRPEDPGP
jgi:Fe2+ transport system protein FeoA